VYVLRRPDLATLEVATVIDAITTMLPAPALAAG
jgi:hypothetical protein